MKNLNNYIFEKLKIDKDTKIESKDKSEDIEIIKESLEILGFIYDKDYIIEHADNVHKFFIMFIDRRIRDNEFNRICEDLESSLKEKGMEYSDLGYDSRRQYIMIYYK